MVALRRRPRAAPVALAWVAASALLALIGEHTLPAAPSGAWLASSGAGFAGGALRAVAEPLQCKGECRQGRPQAAVARPSWRRPGSATGQQHARITAGAGAGADVARSELRTFWAWFLATAKTDDHNLETKEQLFTAIESEREARAGAGRSGARAELNREILRCVETLIKANPTAAPASVAEDGKSLYGKWFLQYAVKPSRFPYPLGDIVPEEQFREDGIPLYMIFVFRGEKALTRQMAVSKPGVKRAEWFNMDTRYDTDGPNKLVEAPWDPPGEGFTCKKTRGRANCIEMPERRTISLDYLDQDMLIVHEPEGGPNYQVFTRRAGPARRGKRGFLLEEV